MAENTPSPIDQLVAAAHANNRVEMERILRQNPTLDINGKDSHGDVALIVAIANGSEDAINALVNHGALVDTMDDHNNTPLRAAIENGYSAMTGRLLETWITRGGGININRTFPPRNETYLMLAARANKGEIIRELLINGEANKNAFNREGDTALTIAAQSKNANAVSELLTGADAVDINLANSVTHKTALEIALDNRDLDTVTALCAHPNVSLGENNVLGARAMALAASQGNTDIIDMMTARGISINAQDAQGNTALMAAVRASNETMVQTLIDRHANLDITNTEGETALAIAMREAGSGIIENQYQYNIAARLVRAGAGQNVRDRDGETLLTRAIKDYNLPMIELLCQGNLANTRNAAGETPLTIAARMGHANITETLVTRGHARINEPDGNGEYPLIVAARGNNYLGTSNHLVVQKLIELGADITVQGKDGKTAIQLVSDYDTMELLLAKGARPYAPTTWMRNAGYFTETGPLMTFSQDIENILRDPENQRQLRALGLDRDGDGVELSEVITALRSRHIRVIDLDTRDPAKHCNGNGDGHVNINELTAPFQAQRVATTPGAGNR